MDMAAKRERYLADPDEIRASVRFKELVDGQDLTHIQLAELWDVSAGLVSQWATKRGAIPAIRAKRIAAQLGVDPAEISAEWGWLQRDMQASQPARLDGTMLAESISALRRVARNQGWSYDPEDDPDVTIYAYTLRCGLSPTPSTADVIDFGQKLAERLQRRAEGRIDEQGNGGSIGSPNRNGPKGKKR